MGLNGRTGQLKGPFKANTDLMALITQEAVKKPRYIEHIGIQAKEGTIVKINDKIFHIGKTDLYELTKTAINTLILMTEVDENALIDYSIII